MRVDFYQYRNSLDSLLAALCEKALSAGRILIKTKTLERSQYINSLLWTYNPSSFLPHGTKQDGHAEHQPIFITHLDKDVPNGAKIYLSVDGDFLSDATPFDRIIYFINGHDEETIFQAKKELNRLRQTETNIFYHEQTDNGKWEER